MMTLVARRYAQALVDISFQEDTMEIFHQELVDMIGLFDKQLDFRLFLLNPKIKAIDKKEVIKKLFAGNMKKELVNFLQLLIDKGRIRFLPGILHEFDDLADKAKKVLNMTIVSAAPLEEAQINHIRDKYIGIHKAFSSKIRVEIDEKLIGGIKVIIGDNVVDGSVIGRLESLKKVLMS